MKFLFFPRIYAEGFPGIGLLFLRLICGVGIAFHGYGKIQTPLNWMGADSPVPAPLQFLAAVSEFFGGIAIAVGFLTPLACLGVMSTMFVAILSHLTNEATPTYFVKPGRVPGDAYELPLIYFVMALSIILCGPGKVAIDALIFRKKKL
jgi:putative oxidoreductase